MTAPVFRHSLAVLAAATFLGACADRAPVGPGGRAAGSSGARLTVAEVAAASDGRLPDLGTCQNLQVPEGSKVSFHVFGVGVQIYRWNGVKWDFVAPQANLYADAGQNGLVGTHFGGPTWLTVSGSKVVGTVAADGRCTPDASAIQWLKLDAVASGTGVFEQTTLIQRLNTVGGLAPSANGSAVGETVSVPYTADYYFYRAP